ncbi:MAG TPA: hypothetical protein VHB20_04945 [Verrucomicrobiae bacterium]|jgi:hypothetical protein|nr:hypothetical protein [Verrucomicrobiae bacterium]
MDQLTEILQRLHDGNVEFCLIGGLAAVHYGSTFVTVDIDVCARFTRENLKRLEATIANLHPFHRMTRDRRPLELTDELMASLKNLYLGTDLGVLDCLSKVAGIGGFEEVMSRSVLRCFPFGQCYVLKIEALIDTKMAIGSAKDKLVASQLKAIQERHLHQKL